MERAISTADPATPSASLDVADRPPTDGFPVTIDFSFTVTTSDVSDPVTMRSFPIPSPELATGSSVLGLVHWLTHSLVAGAGWLEPALGLDLHLVRDTLQVAHDLVRAGLVLRDLVTRLDTSQVAADTTARGSAPAPASRSAVVTDRDATWAWRHRLVFDAAISKTSPVVQGTCVTVEQIVSMVVDGWSWAEILSALPELTEDDIRACLTYSVEEEGAGLCLSED